jgi:hypothetical protein
MDWKMIRDILLVIGIILFLILIMPSPKPGDKIPLTPPESLYAPRGSVQIVK